MAWHKMFHGTRRRSNSLLLVMTLLVLRIRKNKNCNYLNTTSQNSEARGLKNIMFRHCFVCGILACEPIMSKRNLNEDSMTRTEDFHKSTITWMVATRLNNAVLSYVYTPPSP